MREREETFYLIDLITICLDIITEQMSKRKATIDLSEQSFKVQKYLNETPTIVSLNGYRQGKKRPRHYEIHYPSVKQCIRSSGPIIYHCSLHDSDRDVCLIYDCSGGRSLIESSYNYIN